MGALVVGCTVDSAGTGVPGAPTAGTSQQVVGGAASGGTSGLPGAGTTFLPTGGTTGVTPTGGTAGVSQTGGSAGANAAGAGGMSGGGPGAGGSGPFDVPRGKSTGCGKQSAVDEPGKYVSHDIDVTGVDPYWDTKKPYPGQAPYTFTHRAFSIRLPPGYDPSKAYPIVMQGGGCGNSSGTSGKTGAHEMIPGGARQSEGIAIGLSYIYPDGGGACFEDDGAKTYEVPYFDAVYKQVTENYCVDLGKVFIGGYSSGAWESYTMGFARGGKIRGIGTGAGGIREERPTPSNLPFAAMLVTGFDDNTNPYHKTKDNAACSGTEAEGCFNGKTICGFPGATDCYDTGSAHARDEILKRNGCVGNATQQWSIWADCLQYTGCPAAFPVVMCRPPGEGHGDGGDRGNPGIWDFWMKLPAVP
jgi:poly(3-hydroxybutyrate) depolymerase